MPRYRVSMGRWASVSQSAEVEVEAGSAEEADELAWDQDIPWRLTKVIDSDSEVYEVTEIKD